MIHLHISHDPPRAETYLARRRLWACATEPGERLRDVLRHLAAQLVAAGVPLDERAVIWPTGGKQRGPVRLARLLASETATKAPPAASSRGAARVATPKTSPPCSASAHTLDAPP